MGTPASLYRSCILLAAIVCLCVATAYSQSSNGGVDSDPGDPGTGGVNIIDGKIYYPGGRTFDRRVAVRLRSVSAGDQYTYTDTNGAFTFRRLSPGTYNIMIEAGSDFERVNETVDVLHSSKIRGQSIGNTFTVQINLQPAKRTAIPASMTVSARGSAVPDEAAARYRDAIRFSKAGDKSKAVEALKKALAIYPEFMLALNELGVQYLRLRQPEKAVAPLRDAIKIAPDAFEPRLNYGIALVRTKSYEAASQSLRKALEVDASSAAAHLYLGEALIGLADYKNAEMHLLRSIEIGGEDGIEAHRYLAAALIETSHKIDAARELETYLRLNPKVNDADRIKQVIRDLRGGN